MVLCIITDHSINAGCEEELETNALYGNYNWGNVAAGAWGKLPCFHGNNDNTAVSLFFSVVLLVLETSLNILQSGK